MDIFPGDYVHTSTGFGGDPDMNREQHWKSIKKTPVILSYIGLLRRLFIIFMKKRMNEPKSDELLFLKAADYVAVRPFGLWR